ncbi:MAG: TatD family hydrolase, partial [Anaerolineales bacterium]|nr:TatD family hydrolase [Anaerolineales bacterium]
IDAHCHLDDEPFANDLDAVIARAEDAGVSAIITAGADVASSRAAVALAERYTIVSAVIGIHPQYAATWDDEKRAAIRDLAAQPKVVGIGEIGLDFHYADSAPRETQERSLIAQLDLAAELGKPVVIHNRDADDALMDILRQRAGKPRGILHCFSGDLAMARKAIDLGFLISFAGSVTFKNAPRLHALASALPLEHLVVETDAPYLSPLRGKRNEPANVARVAAKIAELKKIEPATVARITTENCRAVLGLSVVSEDS